MKTLKIFGMAAAFLAILYTGAYAEESWFMGLEDYARGVPSQQDKPSIEPAGLLPQMGEGVLFEGDLVSVNPRREEITVWTVVPGILGPERKEIPFRITEDTTFTACTFDMTSCQSLPNGREGLDQLSKIDKDAATLDKSALVVVEFGTGRIVHVQTNHEIG